MHGPGPGWWTFVRFDEQASQPRVTWALLKRVAEYGKPYGLYIFVMLGTILATSVLSIVPPLLYRDLVDVAIPNQDLNRLGWLAVGMIGIPVLNGLLGIIQRYANARTGEGIICDLRQVLFQRLQRMSLRFFTNTRTGELMSRLNNDVVGAQQAITSTVVNLLSNSLTLVATLAIMLSLEWRLTLIAMLVLPFFILPARRVGRILRQIRREQLDANAQMNALMNEVLNVSGALLVKLFGREADENARFGERARKVRDIGIRQALVGRWFFAGLGLASAVGTAVVFFVGAILVIQGEFTLGTIVAFGAYLNQLYGPITALTNARVEFVTSMVSFERVFEVLDLPLEITEAPEPVSLGKVNGHIQFENVCFSYAEGERAPGTALEEVDRGGHSRELPPLSAPSGVRDGEMHNLTHRWALRDVSFEVDPGQLAALVGPSGAGKSTITYLLPRLYDPTDGRILLDGHDLRELSLASLSNHIGMVTQETYLFHDSIKANLLYAKPQATQAELETACRAANIHDFIAGLPQGYETIVGERGYRLSGGEKQRVAIARVILKNPAILVLDEATSSLDSHSEQLIQQALETVMIGRTSLVIAHRLSTVLSADTILVLDGGQVVEQGNHAELLAKSGLYASLYTTQFRTVCET